MSEQDLQRLMYPLGLFATPVAILPTDLELWRQTITETPSVVETLITDLNEHQLNFQYRPNGWTIAQVVHHMSDSHMNAFIRFKLTLTEDTPIIKPYREDLWAELKDGQNQYLHHALSLLKALHAKWAIILQSMNFDDYINRSYIHPQNNIKYTLGEALALYDWHCKHHCQHIRQALKFEGNF